jgi:transposase
LDYLSIALNLGVSFRLVSTDSEHHREEKGLYIFFLPPYCSEMNTIETEWHQLKEHEIAGQMFDNEYDLALAVMEGIKARSEAGNYTQERFIFNCA